MQIFKEVRNDYFEEEENKIYIDGYETDDDNEEGTVIAKIDAQTLTVEYTDLRALECPLAQTIIKETIKEYADRPKIKIYISKATGNYHGIALIAAESAAEANEYINAHKKFSNDNNRMGLNCVTELNVIKSLKAVSDEKGILLNEIKYFSPEYYE